MTARDVLEAARACAAQGMSAASLMQVFELSESQVCRILAELDQPPTTPTEETPPCPLS